jgi:LacI family transcriptional regulator
MQSFFAEIATALTAALAPQGYHLLISHSSENAAEELANIELLVSRKVDGLIIASAQRSSTAFKGLKTPYVLIDRRVPGLDANYVGTNNDAAGFMATNHLIEQGCVRIGHIKGPAVSSAAGRLRGYRRALEQHHLKIRSEYIIDAGHQDAAGYQAMQRLLALSPRPDAVFCFNDPVAIGAMRAILEAGLSIPQDIAVVGVANMHNSDMLRIPLSTVDQGTPIVGEQAARVLLNNMGAKRRLASQQIIVPPRLIVRDSSLRRGRG